MRTVNQLQEEERLHEYMAGLLTKKAEEYREKASSALAARLALEASSAIQRRIPVISLCGTDEWKVELPKCFDQPVSKTDDVKTGFTGSIGECYGITESWESVLGGATSTEDRISVIKEKNYVYPEGSPRAGKPVHLNSMKYGIVPFYEFSQQVENPYFAIKKGGTAYWLAKKTSGYSFTPGRRYPHRISFEIVRRLTEEEGNLATVPGNVQQTVRYKTLTVPA